MTEDELNFLTDRKRGYQLAFSGPAGATVIKDLTRFCRAKMTTKGDQMLEGRRQVFLRIQQHLELDVNQLHELYSDIGDY
jgi:hypothetical protein